ncbi:hypothetical protein [Neisseria meningitidis]|uniref:hypothetical protein n=1 Tax=Neisseria meningitidis TaxID=487 RepID=UPI001F404F32|nr:hypothetical protein [Neisseria meningitidis]
MNEYSQLIKHPDISLPPVSDGIKVDNPATGETLAFVRKTDSDKLKNLIQKAAAAQKLWAAKLRWNAPMCCGVGIFRLKKTKKH